MRPSTRHRIRESDHVVKSIVFLTAWIFVFKAAYCLKVRNHMLVLVVLTCPLPVWVGSAPARIAGHSSPPVTVRMTASRR